MRPKIFFVASIICLFCLVFPFQAVKAQLSGIVHDPIAYVFDRFSEAKKWIMEDLYRDILLAGWSSALHSAVTSALNTIAYDTATWLGSGGKGQKPMFVTEGWGEYLSNIGDNAAGTFLETLGKSGVVKFNLCDVSVSTKIQIGLGLTQYSRPKTPSCTFSKMKTNWEESIRDKDFLSEFQNMFNPAENDFGVALTLFGKNIDLIENAKYEGELKRMQDQGWNSIHELISGRQTSPPGEAKSRIEMLRSLQVEQLTQYTGHALTDALKVFVNQFFITMFNTLMERLAGSGDDETTTSPYGDFYDFESSSYGESSGGVAGAKAKLRKINEFSYNEKRDYSILSELALCPSPEDPGPTNCVVPSTFSDAISKNLTVGQALKDGFLKGEGHFGFTSSEGLEPDYLTGYPYRSLLILRKFRIIPSNWEVAAQYIREHYQIVNQTKSLQQLVDCYSTTDDYNSTGYSEAWCKGLIDPDWVLMAPKNYCRRMGYGSDIEYEKSVNNSLMVSRSNNYCADEQTCIKMSETGSCDLYGYCTQERRTWDFESDSCDAVYNTCQTFRSRSGKTASLLQNTLDYDSCDADNKGCKGYCTKLDYTATSTGAYERVEWDCDSSIASKLYLDKDAVTCAESAEGCHEYIRTKTKEANLLPSSSFEADLDKWFLSNPADIVLSGDEYLTGEKSLKITHTGGTHTYAQKKIYAVRPGDIITISYNMKSSLDSGSHSGPWLVVFPVDSSGLIVFNEYLKAGDSCIAHNCIEESVIADIMAGSADWKHVDFTFTVPKLAAGFTVEPRVQSLNGSAYFEDIIVSRSNQAVAYSDYRENGLVYEKLLPDYLEKYCYKSPSTGDYSLKSDALDECSSFARKCTEEEAGCELYTSYRDKFAIPAKVVADDYCPQECDGYDTYIQQGTYFESRKPMNFIPSTAEQCTSNAEGCDEFTNLDKKELEGESKEYYTQIRICIKPDSSCDDFYAWEGSDESGFQLKAFSLEKSTTIEEPIVTNAVKDAAECSEAIFLLPPSDPLYNPDCREFYSKTGEKSYHLYSLTISCSEDCHPFRKSENNYDPSITMASCVGADMSWDASESACIYCINGGVWSTEHEACIYNGIPGDGKTCSSNVSGCRQYTGNYGNNMQTILSNDFEDGTAQGWAKGPATIVSNSNVSLQVSGHSLSVQGSPGIASTTVFTSENSSYVLSFIVKSTVAGGAVVKAYFTDGVSSADFSATTSADSEWQFYKINLEDTGENIYTRLAIEGTAAFYVDSIKLVRITNRYFLIKGSWDTPLSCDNKADDPFGEACPAKENRCDIGEMLKCSRYYDRDKTDHTLRSFSQLCQESAVGCELLIDTHNSQSPYEQTLPGGSINPQVTIASDNPAYVVYSKNHTCASADKGCQRMGSPTVFGPQRLFDDSYIENNPDDYDNTLCSSSSEGCEENTASAGTSYFIEPGDYACEYRSGTDGTVAWWQKSVSRCDDGSGGGAIDGTINKSKETKYCRSDEDCGNSGGTCTSDSDCPVNQKCITGLCNYECVKDENEYDCPTSDLLTFGTGATEVLQPESGYAGLCPASEATCTEYIDPLSGFSSSFLFNNTLGDIDGDSVFYDGWTLSGDYYQDTTVDYNTLYVLSVSGAGNGWAECKTSGKTVYELLGTNELGTAAAITSKVAANSLHFYSGDCDAIRVWVSAGVTEINLRRAIIDYQLSKGVDKTTCAGTMGLNDGCILFNERTVSTSTTYASLDYDADNSLVPGKFPTLCSGVGCDSNNVIKVSPTRTCDKWLACKSKVEIKNKDGEKENVCYDIGLCNGLDSNDNCSSYPIINKDEQKASPGNYAKFANNSGYSKIGYANTTKEDMKGMYPLSKMSQIGENIEVPNGNFEYYSSEKFPIGWSKNDSAAWQLKMFSVVNNPYQAQQEGVRYLVDGHAFLKFSPSSGGNIRTEIISVEPNSEYTLTYYSNTINLSAGGAAGVYITTMDSNGAEVGHSIYGGTRDIDYCYAPALLPTPWISGCHYLSYPGRDWTKNSIRFKVGANTRSLVLHIWGGGTGNAYFDQVSLKPALENRSNSIIPQTCRLYPESDSLSCDYYDSSAIRQKGWPGYCLEYDRYPGDPKNCLMWWPVDRVKGDGLDEGAGYSGKYPVYYCGGFKAGILVEAREAYSMTPMCRSTGDPCAEPGGDELTSCSGCGCTGDPGNDPSGYTYNIIAPGPSCSGSGQQGHYYIMSIDDPMLVSEGGKNYYAYNGDLQSYTACDGRGWNESTTGVKLWIPENPVGSQIVGVSAECQSIYQTVTPSSQNKYWAARVYDGSGYQTPITKHIYGNVEAPFGSINPPDGKEANPYEWNILNPYGLAASSDAHAGSPYGCTGAYCGNWGICSITGNLCYNLPATCASPANAYSGSVRCAFGESCNVYAAGLDPREEIKRLFALGYGYWYWDGSRYMKSDSNLWSPPDSSCGGGVRAGYPWDYCGIAPKLKNLKINSIGVGDITVNKTGTVNFTFNSEVDSQQVPLTMFSVDWGDNERTFISGIEIRDKQNIDEPHSLYHLYDYWDLRKKKINNVAGSPDDVVYCGTASALALNKAGVSLGKNCPAGAGCCIVRPSAKIRDNWGWCNLGATRNDCDGWDFFSGYIIVEEK